MRQSHAYDIVGVIQPVNLGTGSDGSGTHFLADDKTYKAVSGSGGATTIAVSVVAQDTLAAYDPVTITGKKADSANNAYFGKVIGLATTAIAIGFAGDILVDGLMTNGAWSWTPGAAIFLNGTSLSQTPVSMGFNQEIGIAKTSTTIYVDLSVPILL